MPDASRLLWMTTAVLVATTFRTPLAHAESDMARDYPKKPIRFIVPSMAGGASDNVSRTIARKLSETWGQQVIVDNRGGAAGAVALDLTAKAPTDGYTILLLSASHTVDAAINPRGPYDLTNDFAAVSQVTSHFLTLYHHPVVKVGSVKELIAYAKANPGKLAYGSAGLGSITHVASELLGHMAGIKLVHVPYKGAAHAMTAAVTGDVQTGFGSLMSVRLHASAGRLRVLAITAKNRSPVAPELPTLAESGLPGFAVDQWYGVVTSVKVATAVIGKLNSAIVAGLKSPDVTQRYTLEGVTPLGSSAQDFGALIKSDIGKWKKLVTDTRLALH